MPRMRPDGRCCQPMLTHATCSTEIHAASMIDIDCMESRFSEQQQHGSPHSVQPTLQTAIERLIGAAAAAAASTSFSAAVVVSQSLFDSLDLLHLDERRRALQPSRFRQAVKSPASRGRGERCGRGVMIGRGRHQFRTPTSPISREHSCLDPMAKPTVHSSTRPSSSETHQAASCKHHQASHPSTATTTTTCSDRAAAPSVPSKLLLTSPRQVPPGPPSLTCFPSSRVAFSLGRRVQCAGRARIRPTAHTCAAHAAIRCRGRLPGARQTQASDRAQKINSSRKGREGTDTERELLVVVVVVAPFPPVPLQPARFESQAAHCEISATETSTFNRRQPPLLPSLTTHSLTFAHDCIPRILVSLPLRALHFLRAALGTTISICRLHNRRTPPKQQSPRSARAAQPRSPRLCATQTRPTKPPNRRRFRAVGFDRRTTARDLCYTTDAFSGRASSHDLPFSASFLLCKRAPHEGLG